MPADKPIYTVGDFWLAKRRDGKSPDVWQIATYSTKSRSVVYRSTRKSSLDDAKAAIHAHVEMQRAKAPQRAEDALVVPQLFLYWREHGADTSKPAVIAGSIRAFIGFLAQDDLGVGATVAQLNQQAFVRFRKWRMKPHSFNVTWEGSEFPLASRGINGESMQRNLNDIRAALNHAAAHDRIPYAPKVPSVPTEMRSPARDVRVSLETLGAMVGFASQADKEKYDAEDPNRLFRYWLLLMIGTACRPQAGLVFDPRVQWSGDLIDLQPVGRTRTKKRNPVVPTIDPLRPILERWRGENVEAVYSRKTAWNTMRRALGLPANVVPKTIRYTVATEMRRMGVPAEQISGILGHVAMSRITEVYAKYDPAYLREAKAALTTIFETALRHSETWAADHRRTKEGNGRVIVVARQSEKG